MDEPRKIGLLTNIPTPYRLPLFQLLSEQPGVSLHVAFNASTEKNRDWQLPDTFDFPYQILPGQTISLWRDDLLSYHVNWGLREWLARDFDVVIVGGYASLAQQLAILQCKRRGVPVVLWSGSTAGEAGLARTISLPIVRQLVRRCDAYVAYGTSASQYLQTLGAPTAQIRIAPNTVDIERWVQATGDTRDSRLAERLDLVGRRVFLYVGQLIHRKGVDLALRAFARMQRHYPHTGFVIAGSGSLERQLREQTADLGVEGVRYVGNVPYSELPEYYSMAHAVVLPSRSEVWGLTINEAMASARPVIASDVTGAAQDMLIHGENGWVARNESVGDLTSCFLASAAQTDEERQVMGRSARARVLSHFTLDRTADGLLEAIQVASSARSGGAARS